MVGNITFLMIFAVFDPSPLTLDKLQFLVLIAFNNADKARVTTPYYRRSI